MNYLPVTLACASVITVFGASPLVGNGFRTRSAAVKTAIPEKDEGLIFERALILMDLSLPEIDGWEAAQELKADPKTAQIPLLALTAHTLPGDRQRALALGFDGYISKPIDVAKFGDNISKALLNNKKKE